MTTFPCTQCGLCCKTVGQVIEQARQLDTTDPLLREVQAFPYQWDESGRCEHLAEDNRCRVYDSRPDVCNIDRTWEKYRQDISKDAYHAQAVEACTMLMHFDNLNKQIKP